MIIKKYFMLIALFTSLLIKTEGFNNQSPTGYPEDEITPYKCTDSEIENGNSFYQIPSSSRFTTKRIDPKSPDIIYYFSRPSKDTFPIVLLIGGSSLQENIQSIIFFHRYFLKEFLDLGIGVITIEQRGVDGNKINIDEFMEYYTRSNRLEDHCTVIEHLKKNPPQGWNRKFIILSASEGGLLATTLTTHYADMMIATINWSGAGDFSWRDELWIFIQDAILNAPWYIKLRAQLPLWMPYSFGLYISKSQYDSIMDEAIKNPTTSKKFMGMTYKYHADALNTYPKPEYKKITTPYLVVAGTNDSAINSSDAFVSKAQLTGAPITYLRISGMDHYVRKRKDVIDQSFYWLTEKL